jgi:hypothetical protein
MRERLGLALASLGLAFLPGCIFAHFETPLDTDLDATKLGTKEGRASLHSIFWLVAWGDAGTRAAAENGGITTLRHADLEVLNVLLGIYVRETTIVYGD